MRASARRFESWVRGAHRQWRVAREQSRQARRDRQDVHAAEELQRARDGYDRFPPPSGS
jgi:hypothetical protein